MRLKAREPRETPRRRDGYLTSRHPDFPDVPTLEENGIKGVDGGPYFGFYARNGTPRPIVDRLNAEVQKVMQEPAVRERFRTLAVNLAPAMTPDQFAAYVRAEYDRYAKLLAPKLNIFADPRIIASLMEDLQLARQNSLRPAAA